MEVMLNEINNFSLNELDDNWVNDNYCSEFVEFTEFPSDYETILDSIDVPSAFKNIIKSVNQWLANSDCEISWTTLSLQFHHQKLLALLGYYIDNGIKNIENQDQRNNACLAARVYYKLLSIPGSKAYHIYHSQLFARSLACLSFPKVMCENENLYFNHAYLSNEVNSVIRQLSQFVHDLRFVIEFLQLDSTDLNFEDILSNLVDTVGGSIVNRLNIDQIQFTNLSRDIYEVIDVLLSGAQGNPNAIAIRLLFKCLLPKLILASSDNKSSNNLVRASYVSFSGLLLGRYGKAALPGFIVLLQHLCYTQDGLERADVRAARVSLVVGLMSFLPKNSYPRIVDWIIKLSTTSKVPHRQIALEILSYLLYNEPEGPSTTNTNQIDNTTIINGRARHEEGNVQLLAIDDPGEGPSTLYSNNEMQMSVDDNESSQDTTLIQENASTEDEDMDNPFGQRAHTVQHATLLRAIYERVSDVSSAIRTRALTILTDCITVERQAIKDAIKELNDASEECRLMSVCALAIRDERAAVRRAALPLLQRVLTAGHSDPSPADLAIIVDMCRDASILVRSAAISALGELAISKPSEAILDAFLSGPMHQLSDPENKVQGHVVSLIQNLLIDRLQKYVSKECEDPLPWLLLASITRKNMRRHLQKACMLIVTNGNCINHRLVDILSTHLGTGDEERDLYCLVILTSLARHVQYNDVGFVLQYYYKLTDNTQGWDDRLMSLTVELMSTWSQFIVNTDRSHLRDHLVKRLAVASDDGSRVSSATLAAQLDPSNLQWATQLLQFCESRALVSNSVSEWVRCADIALVAPSPPSTAFMRKFLSALANPPPEWSEAELGACVAGAGRLCLRSREVAAGAAPVFAELLRNNLAPLPARYNSLLTLTDICTRYTCIVEPLLECVCECLSKGGADMLRRGAARALTRLLLSGFLRLRTPLYYRYCAHLADDDQEIREPIEYYVTRCLTSDTIYHHFVDSIIYYNKEETENVSFDARQHIYDVMLQRMTIGQKLNVQCKLAREVFQHAADMIDETNGEINESLKATVLDTITVLSGPRMKQPKKPQPNGDTMDIDDLQERVTSNIASHKMKRTVAEVVVPSVLRLHSRLTQDSEQLEACLKRFASDLLSEYSLEIEEVVEQDEELQLNIQKFKGNAAVEPNGNNARNLVNNSVSFDPVTPRAPRKRMQRMHKEHGKKRSLNI